MHCSGPLSEKVPVGTIPDISYRLFADFRGGEDRKEEGAKTEERQEGISQEGQGERIRAGKVQEG